MENNITKILIKNSGKGVTLPLNSWKRGYGPPPLVLTFTDDPPLWGPSPPPPPKKNVLSLIPSTLTSWDIVGHSVLHIHALKSKYVGTHERLPDRHASNLLRSDEFKVFPK